jgi:hypothetical protein
MHQDQSNSDEKIEMLTQRQTERTHWAAKLLLWAAKLSFWAAKALIP